MWPLPGISASLVSQALRLQYAQVALILIAGSHWTLVVLARHECALRTPEALRHRHPALTLACRYTFWLMQQLCISPKTACGPLPATGCFTLVCPALSPWPLLDSRVSGHRRYRHTSYHKQTKNQWARDDPAFVVICCLLLAVAAAAYCATCVPEVLDLPDTGPLVLWVLHPVL